jgi:hypothetical protein
MTSLLSKKQICMEVGYMLDSIVWLLNTIVIISIAMVLFFIGRGFVKKFRLIYKAWKAQRIIDSVFRNKRGK